MNKCNTIELAFSSVLQHGEGPIWDGRNGCFYWVDLLKGNLYKGHLKSGKVDSINIGQALGAVGLSNTKNLVLAVEKGFGVYNIEAKNFMLIDPIAETLNPKVRFNDGIVGPDGKFYAGTMHWDGKNGFGSLIRFSPNGKYDIIESNHTIPNGMGWNNDRDTFFMVDTGHHCIYAFDFVEGELSRKRVIKKFKNDEHPDGMAIDSKDHFWIAMWGGAKIVHLDEKANYVEEIGLPVKYPTSCCFGGENKKQLFITSSRLPLDKSELENDLLSGSCFVIQTEHTGKTEYRFG
ncbi:MULTISPECIES: SMP-30/gluconolactonase/LRE family protein [Flavobacteriaceae]|uniref:SMP-30/gluconolactonase/LRE family protein n=1 Tax=Flavobacteriaceae TaxID=49546 RepID=UPI001490A487|nr:MULTISPECIES: SMP-30/gluconolactonase/LRE family protein [Allomuricauda]MDC6367322.1 SMP-30/gluconolactonase/LRE family protein [Muricauda sp. AC10]